MTKSKLASFVMLLLLCSVFSSGAFAQNGNEFDFPGNGSNQETQVAEIPATLMFQGQEVVAELASNGSVVPLIDGVGLYNSGVILSGDREVIVCIRYIERRFGVPHVKYRYKSKRVRD